MKTPVRLLMPAFRFGIHEIKEAEKLLAEGVGGFCIYGGTAQEVSNLTFRLQAKASYRLLFASDFENGAGSQLKDMTELPSNMAIGASGQIKNAALKGRITARQAKALGINWIFAPVVDLSVNPKNPIVNVRAFGESLHIVLPMAQAFIKNAQDEKVAACLKHFPGHGDTSMDSHLDLAHIETTWKILSRRDLAAYKRLAHLSASIMTGHLLLKEIDFLPVSLSKIWISKILRKEIGFKGIIVTDALMMGAIEKNFGQENAIKLSLQAGNDILLYPQNPWSAIKTLRGLYEKRLVEETIFGAALKRVDAFPSRLYPRREKITQEELKEIEKKHFQNALSLAREGFAWIHPPKGGTTHFKPFKKGWLCYREFGNKSLKLSTPAHVRLMHDHAKKTLLQNLLAQKGFRLISPEKKQRAGQMLIAIFHKPRAFSGTIGLAPKEIKRIRSIAGMGHSQCIAISFGDPYLLRDLPETLPAMTSFSGSKASQLAAIEYLQGSKKLTNIFPDFSGTL